MYWMQHTPGRILKARMDGSSVSAVVSELKKPAGIILDPASDQLFWLEKTYKIQSSNRNGAERRVVLRLPKDTDASGIAVHNGRIYWGNQSERRLQSCSTYGEGIQTLYAGKNPIQSVILATRSPPTVWQVNACGGRVCPGRGDDLYVS